MKRMLAWRLGGTILQGYFAVLGIVAFAGLRYLQGAVKPAVRQTLETSLVDQAGMLAAQIASSADAPSPGDAQKQAIQTWLQTPSNAKVYGVRFGAPNERVYVTDAQGIVVYDSAGHGIGQNYTQWNDVARTLRGEYGARSSHEGGQDSPAILYVAAPIVRSGKLLGVVSIGKYSQDLDPFVIMEQKRMLRIGALALFLSLGIGIVLSAVLARSIGRLTMFAEDVAAGKPARLPALRGELGVLARALETMREKLEGKHYVEETVQTMAHEMRSPLTAIVASAEVIADGMPEGDERRLAESVGAEAARLSALVDRMLSLAVAERRRELGERVEVDLSALTDRVFEREERRAESRGLRMIRTGEGVAIGDPFLLDHALANLVSNAIDFASRGTEVHVDILGEQRQLVIRVRNQGAPIPDYAAARLFERFFSTERPDTGRKSTGLGLAFVRRVSELHGGDIQLGNVSGGVEAQWRLLRAPVLQMSNSSNLHQA